jgi:UDP-N-acetylmuramoyl-L-alanyl-D-glutamate--2,6-diaminopimelate ligase
MSDDHQTGSCRQWSLASLLAGFAPVPQAIASRLISGLTLDSRHVHPDYLFLAWRGVHGHGMRYAQAAVQQGCCAIVSDVDEEWTLSRLQAHAEHYNCPIIPVSNLRTRASALAARFYHDPSQELYVFAITGTNGKTSISHYLAQAFAARQHACAVVGTLGQGFLGQLKTSSSLTTPDPITLQAVLRQLCTEGAQAVAVELSSHALDQDRAAGLQIDQAILTHLGRDHFDYHGNEQAYAAAKRRLFRYPGVRWHILNVDDALGRELWCAAQDQQGPAIGCYSLQTDVSTRQKSLRCDLWVRGSVIEQSQLGQRLQITTSAGSGCITTPLFGTGQAANILATLTALLASDWPLTQALAALQTIRAVPGRLECFGGTDHVPLLVVDYAHTPDGLEHALAALRPCCSGRLVCLFGCGGERDRGKRPLMAAIAERWADQVILTDDNPRSESSAAIIDEILGGFTKSDRVVVIPQRQQAIDHAFANATPADVVLIAGKGHETTQWLNHGPVPWSDRDYVMALVHRALGLDHGQ